MKLDVDVLVVGAGPAGLACAIELGQRGVNVGMVEGPRRVGPPGETLSPAGAKLLERLGLGASLASDHQPGFTTWSAWGTDQVQTRDFLFDPRGHAWFVDRPRLEQRMRARADDHGLRSFPGPARRAPRHEHGAWTLELPKGPVRAWVLVDATGRRRWLARRMGAEVEVLDRQLAAGALGRGGEPPRPHGLVESEAKGWWYSAPGPAGTLALLAFGRPSVARDLRSATALRRALSVVPHTAERVGTRTLDELVLLDAGSSRLRQPVGDAWLAVGDAAMAWDPLSAHGLTVALRSGIDAAEAIREALAGRLGGLTAHAQALAEAWQSYVHLRARIYADERRFSDQPYWAERLAATR